MARPADSGGAARGQGRQACRRDHDRRPRWRCSPRSSDRWPSWGRTPWCRTRSRFPLGLASIKSAAVSPLPGRLLAETGHTGHLVAVALLALACLGIIVSLVVRPPRTVPSATWRLVIGLSLMFVLAPATRFGYFLYPAGLLAWLGISWLGSRGAGGDPPDSGAARSAKAAAQPAYQSANHGTSAASGTMYSTVCT